MTLKNLLSRLNKLSMHQKGFSLILPIISLFALIAGGIFVSRSWKTAEYLSPYPLEQELVLEAIIIEEKEEEVETAIESEETPIKEGFEGKAKDLIKKSEDLIIQAQEFIREEQEKIALIKAAQESSGQIKGLYINEFIASSQSPIAINTRQNIKDLLDETELNGVVIDVKEAYGPNLPDSLKKFIDELHQKGIWVIARICVFRDSSLIEEKPELYLKTILSSTTTSATTTELWKDWGERHWLDPASKEVQDYIIEFSKEVIDFGFDELQFDYVRFPSDGDLENIIYPFYDESQEEYEVIREFFLSLSESLKDYMPSIILSVDLFGYVANQYQALDIGQRMSDAADAFDYISFMLYPSHFYGGFTANEDLKRELPAVYFPYADEDISQVVSNHPYEVILRSVLSASDYLDLYDSQAKIRPWLQDFNLNSDMSRGIYYDAEKIKAQIQGAQDAGAAGWLLWNSSNIYTGEAFNP